MGTEASVLKRCPVGVIKYNGDRGWGRRVKVIYERELDNKIEWTAMPGNYLLTKIV